MIGNTFSGVAPLQQQHSIQNTAPIVAPVKVAPISGEYGIIAGIVAGILHYCLVTSVHAIHGGFNLYNGGFTAGIVCFLSVPILEHYFKSKQQRRMNA